FQILDEAKVVETLSAQKMIAALEHAYRSCARGQIAISTPPLLEINGATANRHFRLKGATLTELNISGFRIVAHGGSPAQSNIYLFDATSGEPRGLVADSPIRNLRTAVSGRIACRALMPQKSEKLALIGTGRIAKE